MSRIATSIPPFWLDPQLTQRNRQPVRATSHPYPSVELAASLEAETSPWVVSLNGTWRFHLVDRPDATPEDFAEIGFDDSGWADIDVPGNWTMQGFDNPIYTNWPMPFDGPPPRVPEHNPTGLYRQRFAIAPDWDGRRIVLHFGGIEGTGRVFVNGVEVGMLKDARIGGAFDITDAARPGCENVIAVQVIRWSDASYLEDQDHWWQAGIHRAVELQSQDRRAWIDDFYARAELSDDLQQGRVRVSVRLAPRQDWPDGWSLQAHLRSPTGRNAWRKPVVKPLDVSRRSKPRQTDFQAEVKKPKLWSAETPSLYTFILSLHDPDGNVVEATACRLGFRRIEMGRREVRINGKRVMFRGVNRHDHHPELGKHVPVARMIDEIHVMKRHNINAVRTSHYPNDPRWLDLCDEYGLYVIDETNLETHHEQFNDLTAQDPNWRDGFLDRGAGMVQRDKHHPSVIFWSLGNESGYGANHDAMAGWIRGYDPSRPVLYEGIARRQHEEPQWQQQASAQVSSLPGALASDVIPPMYWGIEGLVKWARDKKNGETRPLILCEYSHAMGNSNGSLNDYWQVMEKHHGLQGGFIWEWIDHGITKTAADGTPYWAYGGDFGEERHDANFVCDGLVWPDLTPHPAMEEVKYCYRPVAVRATPSLGRGEIEVVNKRHFTALDDLQGYWRILIDGNSVRQGRLPLLRTPPESSDKISIRWGDLHREPGQEAVLDVFFVQRRDTPWAPAGYEVAREQLDLPLKTKAPRRRKRPEPEAVEHDKFGEEVRVRSGALEARFDLGDGALVNLMANGESILAQAPQPTLWRAATDNDGVRLRPGQNSKVLGRWWAWGLHRQKVVTRAVHGPKTGRGAVEVQIESAVTGTNDDGEVLELATHRLAYRFEPGGRLVLSGRMTLAEGVEDVPRIGLVMQLPAGFERVQYYGRGPHECYIDRCASAHLGRYSTTVNDLYVPYIMPQENGGRADTRWVALDDTARGLVFSAARPFVFTALHHTADDLYDALHTCDLQPRPETVLTLDARHRGLGTASCGPDTLERYRIPNGTYRYAFTLRTFVPEVDDPGSVALAGR